MQSTFLLTPSKSVLKRWQSAPAPILNLKRTLSHRARDHRLISLGPHFPISGFPTLWNQGVLRVLRIILVILPEHPSDTKDHLKMEMEIPSSSNVKLINRIAQTRPTLVMISERFIKVSKLRKL
ncbi:hypothetical protein Tco_0422803 [Tanacetum coccineum]